MSHGLIKQLMNNVQPYWKHHQPRWLTGIKSPSSKITVVGTPYRNRDLSTYWTVPRDTQTAVHRLLESIPKPLAGIRKCVRSIKRNRKRNFKLGLDPAHYKGKKPTLILYDDVLDEYKFDREYNATP